MEIFWRRYLLVAWNIIFQYLNFVNGYLDIFIAHKEFHKLIGLEADLFYVKNGAVNSFAIQFRVPVKADHFDIQFSWQSLTTFPLPYRISVEYEINATNAIGSPQISIPTEGYVPQQVETFTINLPCTGKVTLEVPFTIHMFVKGPPRHNDTKLDLKRNKNCTKGFQAPPKKFIQAPVPAPASAHSPSSAQAPSQGPELLGAAACAMGLILVVALIASAMYVRARKQIRQDSLQTSFTTAAYDSRQNVFIRLDPLGRPPSANSGSYATIASLNKFPLTESKKSWFRNTGSTPSPYATALLPTSDQIAETIYSKPESVCPSMISYYASSQVTQLLSTPKSIRNNGTYEAKEKLRRIPNIQPGMLTCETLIKEGTYGRVYCGKLGDSCNVLIKTVVDGASLTQVACLIADASLLIGISHQNILTPMVANTELPGPPEIAYPNPLKGNLKLYLENARELNSQLSTRVLVDFAIQITKGLAHLHSLGIIHKDIATRNCFLDGENVVKISDNALSKDLFPDDYHCLGDNENRPIKWMALETLQQKFYSTSSDIWSLGVLFWELATLAAIPFVEVDPFELGPYLRDGFRLGQPINCPDEFYTVMSCCWLADCKQRPSFPQLTAYLQDFYEDLGKYI
ncbi:tyrosine-protein kinase Drl-like [Condylostylus longicornis]|uniref:tyrosine-protein kinase Drl-like n=1 Tax=Condylostylus longicornis TaxID=2530218 RepID=UPI00244E2891|nr:tyrosine-protein kinase Drl-like [Condylostylus longicornis]XP_055374227.1 tyrosine-protein kinase Drl-like [Condylostylus longicornis]XP_055374228.1 tyrosine-protein kinase Drl-like [Condylostylus longicornis]